MQLESAILANVAFFLVGEAVRNHEEQCLKVHLSIAGYNELLGI